MLFSPALLLLLLLLATLAAEGPRGNTGLAATTTIPPGCRVSGTEVIDSDAPLCDRV